MKGLRGLLMGNSRWSTQVPFYDKSIIDKLWSREERTPDFSTLRMYDYIPVFIYDNMKIGCLNEDMIRGSKFLGNAHTATEAYCLEETMPGRNTLCFKDDNVKSLKRAKVRGEMFGIPPEVILDLDRFLLNGTIYERTLRTFFLEDQAYVIRNGKERIPSLRAWIYLAIPKYWEKFNKRSGQMFTHPKNRHLKNYYEFRKVFQDRPTIWSYS